MTINQRIRNLRKEAKLNQRELGQKLGLGQASVSWLEQDGHTVTESNIKQIASVFGISESWLRTGEGPMARSSGEDYLNTPSLDEMDRALIRNYIILSQEKRKVIKDYILTVAKYE